MSSYNLNLRLESIRTITIIAVDILIMWLVFYYAIKLVRSNSRTIQIFKGILLVIIVDGIAKFFGLKTLEFFADIFLNWGFLAIIIVFQPEIRILLEKLGKTNVFSRINTLTGNEKENLVDQIVKATMLLSQDQTGALISIEQSHSLEDFITTGTKLNSDVTAELLTSIFVTSTPLHDGAVIIQGSRIACASAYFPPTNLELPSRYGARHRAAIGISEITDAVTIVVSEETGAISITEGGKIFRVSTKQLRDYLMRVICGEETEVQAARKKTEPAVPGREILIEDDIHSGEVALPKKEDKAMKRGDTGVLSKLSLKKQPEKNEPEKIEVEEVVTPVSEKEEPHEERKGLFSGLFSKKEETAQEENRLKELEEELSSIKLPKKKERPVPSYPEHESRQEENERIRPVSIHQEEPEEKPAEDVSAFSAEPEEPENRRMTPEEVKAARERSLELLKQTEQPAVQETEEPEEEPEMKRMTPEEVQAAREASLEKLTGKKPIPQVMKPVESYEPEEDILPAAQDERTDEEKMFDTSKLDISKLMGFDDDFDSTFRMVDHLDTETDKTSGDRKGGE